MHLLCWTLFSLNILLDYALIRPFFSMKPTAGFNQWIGVSITVIKENKNDNDMEEKW